MRVPSRRFLGMTKMPLLPIRKLPEVSSIGQVSWCLMALGGIWISFLCGFLVRICLLGCLLRYLVKCLVFNGTIFKWITVKQCPPHLGDSHNLESPGRGGVRTTDTPAYENLMLGAIVPLILPDPDWAAQTFDLKRRFTYSWDPEEKRRVLGRVLDPCITFAWTSFFSFIWSAHLIFGSLDFAPRGASNKNWWGSECWVLPLTLKQKKILLLTTLEYNFCKTEALLLLDDVSDFSGHGLRITT